MIKYYSEDGHLDAKWVDDEAQKAAKSFFEDSRNSIKSSQLRKFYSDIKSLERKWQASGESDDDFKRILPMIKLLKAKSDYAQKRKVVPLTFKKWLWTHVDSIKGARDFKAFLLHFEAVVGFSYGEARGNFN